jgi:hypothetical protein
LFDAGKWRERLVKEVLLHVAGDGPAVEKS